MKVSKLRTIVPLAILAVFAIGFAAHAPIGNLSSFGWKSISIICPLGALITMLASKTIVPRAVISIVFAAVAVLLLGRAFCGWVCPVPVVSELRYAFTKKSERDNAAFSDRGVQPLTKEERKALAGCGKGCGSCASKGAVDSRHIILGGALLSAAIFGFPVFCLICPIGLTFATVVLVMLLFGTGNTTISVIVIPAILLVEVVFFRKWCSHICPISALMSLVGKGNRTFQPVIDDTKCLETAQNSACGVCGEVCEVAIDLRHPQLGSSMSECTRCMACVEACPAQAIHIPLTPGKKEAATLEDTSSNSAA